jgi:hypothetical protein
VRALASIQRALESPTEWSMMLVVGVLSWKVINSQLLSFVFCLLFFCREALYPVFEKAFLVVVIGERWRFLYLSALLSIRTFFC